MYLLATQEWLVSNAFLIISLLWSSEYLPWLFIPTVISLSVIGPHPEVSKGLTTAEETGDGTVTESEKEKIDLSGTQIVLDGKDLR